MSERRTKLAVWAWLPVLLLLSLGLAWRVTGFFTLSLAPDYLMPPLAAWLGHRYGWRACLPFLLVAPIEIVGVSYDQGGAVTLFSGAGIPILVVSFAAALAFAARQNMEPRAAGLTGLLAAPILAAIYFGLSYSGEIHWRAQAADFTFGIYGDPAAMITIAAFLAVASGRVNLLGGLIAAGLLFAAFTWLAPAHAQNDTVVVTGTKLAFDRTGGWVRDQSLAIWAAAGACAGAALMPFWRAANHPPANARTAALIFATLALAFIAPYWSHAGGGLKDSLWTTLPPYLWGQSAPLLAAAAAVAAGLAWPNRALIFVPLLIEGFALAAIALHVGDEMMSRERVFDAFNTLFGLAMLAWTYVWIAAAGPQATEAAP